MDYPTDCMKTKIHNFTSTFLRFHIFLILVCIYLVLFASCSFSDNNTKGSVSFCIDSMLADCILNTSNTRSAISEDTYFEVSLIGDYNETKTIPVVEGKLVVFNNIPVGANVYAEAAVYKEKNDKKIMLYKGKSETITIKAGNNEIEIMLTKVKPEYYTITISDDILNGMVTVSRKEAAPGTIITLTIEPDNGYVLSTLTVKKENSNIVTITKDKNDSTKYTFNMPESNVTLSATFTDLAKYTVRYFFQELNDLNSYVQNTSICPDEIKTGKIGSQTEAEVKTIKGFSAKDFSQETITTDGNTVVDIKYDRNSCTVTFNTNGGTVVESQTVLYGQTVTKPDDPIKDDVGTKTYTFCYWYDIDPNKDSFDFTTPIEDNITLNAYWFVSFIGTPYTELEASTDGTAGSEASYVLFGDWPQTAKDESVTVDEYIGFNQGELWYWLGSDEEWYVKHNADNTYYKVEPIKWRVLTTSQDGKKLLLAENILTANIPYYESYSDRTLNGNTIYVNNYKYSNIRAYLNGTANQFILDSGTATDGDYDWTDKGFLQTAFTTSLQEKIQTTIVDNSAASTNPASNESLWDNGNNGFACDDTSDKIFLLSEKEVTTSDYGFAEYNEYGFLSGRWRIATDYAKINGAITDTDDCGYWFLRTPHFDNFGCVLMVDSGGGVVDGNDTAYDCGVSFIDRGVVPALWVIP